MAEVLCLQVRKKHYYRLFTLIGFNQHVKGLLVFSDYMKDLQKEGEEGGWDPQGPHPAADVEGTKIIIFCYYNMSL